jgi:hypothetical protein
MLWIMMSIILYKKKMNKGVVKKKKKWNESKRGENKKLEKKFEIMVEWTTQIDAPLNSSQGFGGWTFVGQQ